ncbi:ABC-type sugar transport system periplasmic component [Gaiella occulta]|uniref:ABC-type sugar transport system periplasmic component n=1 Tax=Gaiella occulta TaxID=1002870 RepID=A0A7M2YVN3_9ACTN|nr:sugar ABC transporter substrate-binding protein [Gaiella occulta]RDI74201.1 ABC-type sugar transport system periplasmic component [Gaiella occulta]
MMVKPTRWRVTALSAALIAVIAMSAVAASYAGNAAGPKKGLRLAFFSVGGNNTYLLAGMKGAKDAAAKYGASIKVYDGKFDGGLQLNQVMGAIAQKAFDGIVLEPNNSQQLCSAVKAALKAKLVVGITNVPACTAAYEKPYPGTAIFVGGQGPTAYKQWLTEGFKSSSAGGKFAVLVGPITQGNSVRTKQVLAQVNPRYPGWKQVAFQPTEYQASVALAKTQNILQSHPDLKLLFSNYAGQTPGAISAIKAAGKTGQVKIYDLGGDKTMFKAVREGSVASTAVYLPYEEQYRAVEAVVAQLSKLKSLNGVTVGQFWDLTKDPRLKGLSPFVTKANIAKYTAIGLPEY